MIKPHTAAKQETKLLGIRGEEKVNEKKRESESNKGNERREGERKRGHRREKSLWWLLSTNLGLKTTTHRH